MRTTLRWLAAIILLAFIVTNPLIIGGLSVLVYMLGRALNNRTPIVRYSALGIVSLLGACFIQVAAIVFPAAWLIWPFAIVLTCIAARRVYVAAITPTQPHFEIDPDDPDIIEAEVISEEEI